MRYLYSLVFLAFLGLTACSKSAETPDQAPVDNSSFNPATATLLRQGSLTGNMNYAVSGTVKLYAAHGKHYLRFENFSSSNGPDLKVYLSADTRATQFLSLGNLKGVSGTQTYEITQMPDFARLNHLLIWCQQFSVLFGHSVLQ